MRLLALCFLLAATHCFAAEVLVDSGCYASTAIVEETSYLFDSDLEDQELAYLDNGLSVLLYSSDFFLRDGEELAYAFSEQDPSALILYCLRKGRWQPIGSGRPDEWGVYHIVEMQAALPEGYSR